MRMIFDKIAQISKELFGQPEKKEWLDELVKNAERLRDENISVPFKIMAVKETGFLVKVAGLYGFIAFKYMPWKYPDIEYWRAISPNLIDRLFFCKIHKISHDPISIIVNGEIPQFKKLELLPGEKITAIIIRKTNYGFFVDIGSEFGWKYGSFVGLLHKSQFGPDQSILKKLPGDEIQLTYQGLNIDKQLILGADTEKIEWHLGNPARLIGQVVWVEVVKKPGERGIEFLAEGKYRGKIVVRKKDYPTYYRTKIKQARVKLTDGSRIDCLVTGINNQTRYLEFKWIMDFDLNMPMDHPLIDMLDDESIQKLTLIKNEVER